MPVANPSAASNADEAAKLLSTLISKPRKSISTLLKNPTTTTDSSWHLCLPPHFNNALGLKYQQKQQVRDKEVIRRWREWTQGSNFSFGEGSIIYDRDVSGIETWGEKLKAIEFYVVLGPSRPASSKTLVDPASGLKKVERDPGLVSVSVYTPSTKSIAEQSKSLLLTQDEFVMFAITGST